MKQKVFAETAKKKFMESGIEPLRNKIRQPAVAGLFYPSKKGELFRMLEKFFQNTEVLPDSDTMKALIVPHAGYVYSGQTAAWGFAQIPKSFALKHIVCIGPSHNFQCNGLAASGCKYWKTPLGSIEHNRPQPYKQIAINDRPHTHEHCLEVELPFLQYHLKKFSVSCFLTGGIKDIQGIASYFADEYPESMLLISSDLSHYLPEHTARIVDTKTIDAICSLNGTYFQHTENTACGAVAITVLIDIAKHRNWIPHLILYDTSKTAFGDASAVVGYGAIGFYAKENI